MKSFATVLALCVCQAYAGGGADAGSAVLEKKLDFSNEKLAPVRFNQTFDLVNNATTTNTDKNNKLSMNVYLKANDLDRTL